MDTDIIRLRPFLPRKHFARPPIPSGFPSRSKKACNPGRPRNFTSAMSAASERASCAAENYTVRLNTGQVNPLLRMSYIQFAMEGLRHQLSQGAGGWSVEPGDRYTYYKLVDSVVPPATGQRWPREEFLRRNRYQFAGLGVPDSTPAAAKELAKIENNIAEAARACRKRSRQRGCAIAVSDRLAQPPGESGPRWRSEAGPADASAGERSAGPESRSIWRSIFRCRPRWFRRRAPTAPSRREKNPLAAISPGQKFTVRVKLHNGSTHPLQLRSLFLEGQVTDSEAKEHIPPLRPGQDYQTDFQVHLPANTPPTRPALHRNDPERDGVYTVDEPRYQTLPFPPPPFRVSAHYDVPDLALRTRGTVTKIPGLNSLPEISAPVLVTFADEKGAEQKRPLAVVPAFSVELEPGEQIIPIANGSRTHRKGGRQFEPDRRSRTAACSLEAPTGWQIEPKEIPVELRQRGDKKHFEFKVVPGSLKEGHAQIRAVLDRRRQDLQRRLHAGHSRRPGQRLLLPACGAARQHCGCESSERSEGCLHSRARATKFRLYCSRSEST